MLINRLTARPLAVGPIRAFEAVARHSSFSAAAVELHLTQSAISRQIRALEEEVSAPLFTRGTRHVELTSAGQTLLRAVAPSLDRIDATVRQIRAARGRRHVSINTFASFASLWLLPRLQLFQASHPDIDIRISAGDQMADLDDPELDFLLRYCHPDVAPPGAERMFGEVLTPVVSPHLREQAARGIAPPLGTPADLVHYALLEEDHHMPSAEFLSWRHWLALQGLPKLEPQRWVYLNFTYQQIQAALAGQGLALARLSLVFESLERGELVELFGATRRTTSPFCYYLVPMPLSRQRAEQRDFAAWIREQAALTRQACGEAV